MKGFFGVICPFLVLCGCIERPVGGRRVAIRDAARVGRTVHVPRLQDAGVVPIRGFGESWRDEVKREYAKLFAPASAQAWARAVNRCIEADGAGGKRFIAPIREAARLLRGRYPEAFVAGLVIHESWCRANLVTGDGGTGYAQITPDRESGQVYSRWLDRAREILGHEPLWRTDPVDNIVLGLAELQEAETELGSRELGLAAYNAGLGGVRMAMRRHGWQTGDAPLPLNIIAPDLPHRPHRWDARWYAAKVLATTVYANRVIQGRTDLRIINNARFRLEHVPGAQP